MPPLVYDETHGSLTGNEEALGEEARREEGVGHSPTTAGNKSELALQPYDATTEVDFLALNGSTGSPKPSSISHWTADAQLVDHAEDAYTLNGANGTDTHSTDRDHDLGDSDHTLEVTQQQSQEPISLDNATVTEPEPQGQIMDYGRTVWDGVMALVKSPFSERSSSEVDALEFGDWISPNDPIGTLTTATNGDALHGDFEDAAYPDAGEEISPFGPDGDAISMSVSVGRPPITAETSDRGAGSIAAEDNVPEAAFQHTPPSQPDATQVDAASEEFSRKLRRFRKMTDQILMKRTNWRNEYAKLENLRGFFHKSVKKVIICMQIPPSTPNYPHSPKEERRWKRAEAVLKNIVEGELATSTSSEPDSTVPSTQRSQVSSESEPDLALAQKELLGDLKFLKRQEKIVKELMQDLTDLEFRMSELERDISKQMHSSLFPGQLALDPWDEELSAVDSEQGQESASEGPPTDVAAYFDAVGDLNIYLERLEELDFEHDESMVHRTVLQDQGQTLDPPDDVYEQQHRYRRTEIEDILDGLRDQVDQLNARCQQAGLNPELYRNLARSSHSIGGSRPAPMSIVEPARNPLSDTKLARQVKPSQNIRGWVDQVVLDTQEHESTFPINSEDQIAEDLGAIQRRAPATKVSLASFEQQSFDLEEFGLPNRLETG